MTHTALPYAALILPDAGGLIAKPYLDAAAGVLLSRDPLSGGAPFRNPRRGSVQGGRYGIRVTLEERGRYGPSVRLELTGARADLSEDPEAAGILSDTVVKALEHSRADIVEWAAPTVLIDRDDFIALRRYVSPRRGDRLQHKVPLTPADRPEGAIRSGVLQPQPWPSMLFEAVTDVLRATRLRLVS